MFIESLVLRGGLLTVWQRAQIIEIQILSVAQAENVQKPGEGDHREKGTLRSAVLHLTQLAHRVVTTKFAQILHIQRLNG